MSESKKYFLGLDIGTDSVGWCVTDENYNIPHIKKYLVDTSGKVLHRSWTYAFGSRLFMEAKDASTRRQNRSARRRLQRRKWRINLIRDIFRDEMNKVDALFFKRLDNSFLKNEDKDIDIQNKPLLFANYNYKKYPTIYHLRKAMLKEDRPFDIREIYLVISHLIKYRGNFLYSNKIESSTVNNQYLKQCFDNIDQIIKNYYENLNNDSEEEDDKEINYDLFNFDDKQINKINEIFINTNGINNLKLKFKDIAKLNSNSFADNILSLIFGSTVDYKKFNESDTENLKIDFASEDFEMILSNIETPFYDLFIEAKKIYDYRLLIYLLKGKSSLTDAMINLYNEHHNQLVQTKELTKKYKYKDEKDTKKNNKLIYKLFQKDYTNYIGENYKNKKFIRTTHNSKNDFYKTIKKYLDNIKKQNPTEEDAKFVEDILQKIDNDNYLLRQNSSSNGVFPYQLNENDLRKIIENQGKYYPFLLDKAPDYLHSDKLEYKLISILKFKIPYYIGPLSNNKKASKNNWSIKKEGTQNTRITPWNFDDVIDRDASSNAFIQSLTNTCTYILDEEVLPKNSLYIQAFNTLNFINKINVNYEPISFADKIGILTNIYLNTKKVTKKVFYNYFKEKYGDNVVLTTSTGKELDADSFVSNLSSYYEFIPIFGNNFFTNKDLFNKAEEIIKIITVVEDKELRQKQLSNLNLSNDQLDKVNSLNYKGWSRLSKKLLIDLKSEYINDSTGEVCSFNILQFMLYTNYNFMELYETKNVPNTFKEQVEEINKESLEALNLESNSSLKTLSNKLIEDSYTSPQMKRAIYQTIELIIELQKYFKIDSFDRIFVECTRSNKEKKKKKDSRKTYIDNYLKSAKKFVNAISEEQLNELTNNLNKYENNLKSKKMFLYFMQLGKSVYTGNPINIDDLLNNNNTYDIDHIIPQSKLKDDSFTNLVLVEKNLNNSKQDQYPIPSTILNDNGRKWIEVLHKIKNKNSALMPDAKYNALIRRNSLKDDELVGFVNRQLVITNQSVKAVCDILKTLKLGKEIVYSKAENVSDFRNWANILKIRDLNNFHHAHDAYLNIVVGNVYYKTFGSIFTVKKYREEFKTKETNKDKSLKLTTQYIFGNDRYIYNTNQCIWKAPKINKNNNIYEIIDSKGSTLEKIENVVYNFRYEPMVTHMMYKTYKSKGKGFFTKSSLHSAKSGEATMPLKTTGPLAKEGSTNNYGGYSDLVTSSYFLIKSFDKKNKAIYTLEGIPDVYLTLMKKKDGSYNYEKIKEYMISKKLNNPEIILSNLLMRTIIEIPCSKGNIKLGITGRSGSNIYMINLTELKVDKKHQEYIRKISKFLGTNLSGNEKSEKLNELDKCKEMTDQEFQAKYQNSSLFFKDTNQTIKQENNELFNYLCAQIKNKNCFYNLPYIGNSAISLIIENFDKFDLLSLYKQIKLLSQIINLLKCNTINISFDYKDYINKKIGSIYINKQLLSNMSIEVTNATGLFTTQLFKIPE